VIPRWFFARAYFERLARHPLDDRHPEQGARPAQREERESRDLGFESILCSTPKIPQHAWRTHSHSPAFTREDNFRKLAIARLKLSPATNHETWTILALCLFLLCAVPRLNAAAVERAIMVREGYIYLSPDSTSTRMANLRRGQEVAILENSREWLHITQVDGNVTGWIINKGVVRTSTPDGDKIVFGEAADSEAEASRRYGRKGADKDAMRLYYRMAEYFPKSPLAGEALYRAADIRWQEDALDVNTRPSAKERNPLLRGRIDEDWMREVIKKFPGTKWADLAAYHLLENKICGDWAGDTKCPEKESELYEKYVREHPQSPKAAEALYQAARRQAALIQMYKDENNAGRSGNAKNKAVALARQIATQYPQSDWGARAQALLYFIEQDIPTYGNSIQ
jgi:outer membrane protein assembly factor BamD (BamD/ComL family)